MTDLGTALKAAGYRPPKRAKHGARRPARLREALARASAPRTFMEAYREGLARLAAKEAA